MTEELKNNILYPAGSMGLRTKRNIVLIGFRGTGKSTVAMHLHELYHMDVAEMDEIIARREEMSITSILSKKGEAYFRNLETNLLIELQQRDNLIIICGGQTPLFDENVKIMKQNSFIVLMTASPDKIYKRVYQKKEHTPADTAAIIEKTRRTIAELLPKYEGVANMIVNTDEQSTPQTAFDIIHNMMEKSHWLNTINPEIFIRNTKTFDNLMMMYRGTIREIQTKLEVLDDEFSNKYNRNPIAFIKTRIKKPMSIYQKLLRLGYDFTEENIREQLNDVAGVRVICPFIDDIYTVAGLLSEQDDIHVIQIKDYIKNPKENGYRSYHLIVDIPVFFSTGKTLMRAEIQIRTIGMDFWASLEHQLRYKKGMDKIEGYEKISEELQKYSRTIIETDNHMQAIKDMIGDFYDI
jgi:putative GTP pyrophosphokinase